MKKYFLIGIGGAGMSSLAFFLQAQGNKVWGSDRSFDQEESSGTKKELLSLGIQIVPQNGLSLPQNLDGVIYSTAVEKNNPDLISAQKRSLPLLSRAQMLAQVFNEKKGIAISGTSGKTTVVGMLAHILQQAFVDFSFLCGGKVKGLSSNASSLSWRLGKSPQMLIEADESDGSITMYQPEISLITNISKDHKDLDELYGLFQHLINSTRGPVILNEDCPSFEILHRHSQPIYIFGISQTRDIKLLKEGSNFKIKQNIFHLQVPGIHNVINALAAISVAEILEIPIQHIQEGLRNFQGIERRLEHIGCCEKINVYDDYSHNPAKIEAALSALKNFSRRLIVIYQPHGFGPLKLQREDLIQVFKNALNPKDHLILLPIYDAGGTADRSISVEDFAHDLQRQGVPATFFPNRKSLILHIAESAISEDSIIVMGARDNSLTEFSHSLLKEIQNSKIKSKS